MLGSAFGVGVAQRCVQVKFCSVTDLHKILWHASDGNAGSEQCTSKQGMSFHWSRNTEENQSGPVSPPVSHNCIEAEG